MKKRLSFSQLTALSFALLPAQSMIASAPEETTKPEMLTTIMNVPTATPAPQSAGWLSGLLGFGGSSKQLSPEEQLDAEILALAQSGQLFNTESGINPELLKKYDNETLAGKLAKLTRLNGEESSAKLDNMQKEVLALQKTFEAAYAKDTKSLEQLLHAASATNFASTNLFKNAQATRKAHESSVNKMLTGLLNFGQLFSSSSKEGREQMDLALYAAKGTASEFKRSVSPKHPSVGAYAGHILGLKSKKSDQPKHTAPENGRSEQ